MQPFADLLKGGEQILVSCCNLGQAASRYSVAVISAAGIEWLDLDEVLDPAIDKGVTGITLTEDHCFIAVQGDRPRLISLDRNLRARSVLPCVLGTDLHSLAYHRGELFYASTGCNQILSVSCRDGIFDGKEQVRLEAAPRNQDWVHLNSVCFIDERMVYSMFAAEPRERERVDGVVMDAFSGIALHAGLRDPHSVTRLPDGHLGYCESLASCFHLRSVDGRHRRSALYGYLRGCTHTGSYFVVGASHWRNRSRSTGVARPAAADVTPHSWNKSALYFLDDALNVVRRVDFSDYAPEIYDVVFIGERFAPTKRFDNARERRAEVLQQQGGVTANYFKRLYRRSGE